MSAANVPPQDSSRVGTKYRTYKLATDKLAGWLAATTKKLGGHTSKGGSSAHAIQISQFNELTDLVVNATPGIYIPLEIIETAQTALRFRQERAEILRGTDVDSDQRHQHIISTIRDVVAKLKSHMQAMKQQASKQGEAVESKAKSDLIPSFRVLDLDPLASGDESCSSTEERSFKPRAKFNKNKQKKLQKEKKKARKQGKETEVPIEEEDPYFVLMCLLSDLKAMRGYIKEVWQEYKEGQVDLITASLTTNATFDIIRTYETDFPAISHLISDWSKTVRLALSDKLDQDDANTILIYNAAAVTMKNGQDKLLAVGRALSKIPQVAELTFASAFYFLNGPRHVIVQQKDGKMQTIDENSEPFGKYQSTQSRHKLNPAQRFVEDIQILTGYAKQVYKCDDWRHFTLDHFTMQWREEFAKTGDKTITLAQAFGAQLYLDTQHVLRHDSVRALQDLSSASFAMLKTRELWKTTTPQEIYKTKEKMRQMQHNIVWTTGTLFRIVIKPIYAAIEKDRGSKEGISPAEANSVLRSTPTLLPFMRVNPLMCGVLLFEVVHTIRDAGSNISHQFNSIQCAGQIYYGCRMQRQGGRNLLEWADWKEQLQWKDMDYLLDLYGVVAFFDGHIPETNYDLVKHMVPSGTLQVGRRYQSKEIKREGRKGPIITVPKLTKRGLDKVNFAKMVHSYEAIAVTHRLFYAKYMKFIGRKDFIYEWSLESLQALLQTHLDKQNRSGKQSKGMKGVDGDVSQVTILRTLKETLQRESRALNYDFLEFFCYTYLFMKLIKEACPHILEMFIIPNDDDENLYQAVSAIHTAINAPEPGTSLDPFDECEGDDMFTDDGHIILDSKINFLMNMPDFKDKQIQKIDKIWGIFPAQS